MLSIETTSDWVEHPLQAIPEMQHNAGRVEEKLSSLAAALE
jgi:hypothetical protein